MVKIICDSEKKCKYGELLDEKVAQGYAPLWRSMSFGRKDALKELVDHAENIGSDTVVITNENLTVFLPCLLWLNSYYFTLEAEFYKSREQ